MLCTALSNTRQIRENQSVHSFNLVHVGHRDFILYSTVPHARDIIEYYARLESIAAAYII